MASNDPRKAQRRYRRAARTLSSLERCVLVLAAHHDLGNEAIARELGLSSEVVEELLRTGLVKLARALERAEASRWPFR